ncbi:hypothetical protein Droror1_Dr00002819 [Drosera rotundifolia]
MIVGQVLEVVEMLEVMVRVMGVRVVVRVGLNQDIKAWIEEVSRRSPLLLTSRNILLSFPLYVEDIAASDDQLGCCALLQINVDIMADMIYLSLNRESEQIDDR